MPTDPHADVALYALDALDPNEERAFEEHLASCEACREELASLREATAGLAYGAVGPAPPPELKVRILEHAKAERPNVVSLPQRRSWTAPLASVAAVAAAVAIGVGVWAATRPATNDAFTSVLAKPGAQLMPMGDRGTLAVAPDGTAAIALTVPRAPEGKTYEAWVMTKSAAKRAGLFSGATVLRIQQPVKPGSVVAVTLERSGGVDQPTSKPLAASETVS
jgi:anti-sigma-K factor RskA